MAQVETRRTSMSAERRLLARSISSLARPSRTAFSVNTPNPVTSSMLATRNYLVLGER